jgi:hypothetical protein
MRCWSAIGGGIHACSRFRRLRRSLLGPYGAGVSKCCERVLKVLR